MSALIVIVLQRPWRSVPSRSAWPVVLAYGLSLGAMNSVFYLALRTIPLGIAVAIEFIGPLAVAVMALRRRLDYLWVALAALGLSVLLPITSAGAALDRTGVLFALAAGVGWALYIVFGQKAGHAHGAAASTWGLIIAAVVTTPIGIADVDVSCLVRRPAAWHRRGDLPERPALHARNGGAPAVIGEDVRDAHEFRAGDCRHRRRRSSRALDLASIRGHRRDRRRVGGSRRR